MVAQGFGELNPARQRCWRGAWPEINQVNTHFHHGFLVVNGMACVDQAVSPPLSVGLQGPMVAFEPGI
jgi:hypothetical protein